jgi:hypothetical protein
MKKMVCKQLRTKTAFGAVVDNDWQCGDDTSAVYWCLATMESFGPDESFVHAQECGQGRKCFQRPDDAEDAPDIA